MHAHLPTRIFFIFYLLSFILSFSCSPSTAPDSDTPSPRERVTVSGSIMEDAVWESGPEVAVKFAHEHVDEYYGFMGVVYHADDL